MKIRDGKELIGKEVHSTIISTNEYGGFVKALRFTDGTLLAMEGREQETYLYESMDHFEGNT